MCRCLRLHFSHVRDKIFLSCLDSRDQFDSFKLITDPSRSALVPMLHELKQNPKLALRVLKLCCEFPSALGVDRHVSSTRHQDCPATMLTHIAIIMHNGAPRCVVVNTQSDWSDDQWAHMICTFKN